MSKEIEIISDDISETQLEALLIEDIESIEEGMIVLGNQISTGSVGEMDVLAVDKDGILNVIELKIVETDKQLFQGLRYLDWVNSNISLISKVYAYDKDAVTDDNYRPRLVLIAPSFSINLMTAVKYINTIGIDLFVYDVVQSGKQRKLLLNYLEIDDLQRRAEIPSLKGHRDYLDNEKAQELFDEVISYFESKKIGVEVRQRRISFTRDGNIIGRYRGRKGWFKIESILRGEGSVNSDIRDKKDWELVKNTYFEPYL